MKNGYTYDSLALIVILLAIIILGSYHSPTMSFAKIEPTKISIAAERDYILEVNKIEEVKDIAIEVANSHEYVLDSYDCTDFSSELVKQLQKEGYDAKCTAGYYSNNGKNFRHTWVSLWVDNQRVGIESTKGYFIDEEDFKNYDVKMEGYCW